MADILNFNPDRTLTFDPGRPLGFDAGRNLQFDPGRSLNFQPNRDLGFGGRGVVFRGYVCPICGALATEDAPKCTECGAIFESPPRVHAPPVPASVPEQGVAKKGLRERASPLTPTGSPKEPSAADAARKAQFCTFCGAMLKPVDTYCWNCGARSVGPTEAVRLPAQRTEPTTREWRGRREP